MLFPNKLAEKFRITRILVDLAVYFALFFIVV